MSDETSLPTRLFKKTILKKIKSQKINSNKIKWNEKKWDEFKSRRISWDKLEKNKKKIMKIDMWEERKKES